MTSDIGIPKSALYRMLIAIMMFASSSVFADHIEENEDLNILRTPLGSGQGYLNFAQFSNGAEYTGFTNGNETFRDGGQDFSDNSFSSKVIIVTDANGETTATAGGAQFDLDVEYTRKVWAQAGLSVNLEGVANVGENEFSGIGTFPFGVTDRFELAENGAGRSANSNTMNLYYVKSFENSNTLGVTRNAAAGEPRYIFLQDDRDLTTFAHEVGHMLLNGSAVHLPDSADTRHSTDALNLMAPTTDLGIVGLRDIGPALGAGIGGHAKLEPSQIQTVHGNTGANNPGFVSHSDQSDSAGDVADFNWVADHDLIERIDGDSNAADLRDGDQDFLIWEIDASRVQPGIERGHKAGKLEGEGYAASFFKVIDVFSNINRYADNDFGRSDPSGNGSSATPTRRAKALDYLAPEFSVDGIDWKKGELVNVFAPGWTNAATSDNYVARWSTDLEAQFVRIARIPIASVDEHDGNAQIDAIMAARELPTALEPVTFNGGCDDAILDIGGSYEWDQGSVNREQITGKGKIENGGFLDTSFALLDVKGTISDSTSGAKAGTLLDIEWNFDRSSGELPGVFQGTFPLFFGGPNLNVDLNSGTLEDIGQIVPFEDGELFDINVDSDGDFFDILFQVDVGNADEQLMQIHGEIIAEGLSFADAAAQLLPSLSDDPSSLIFGLLFNNEVMAQTNEESMQRDPNQPLFSLSLAGAIVAIPEPSSLTMLVGLGLLMQCRRHLL